MIPTAIHVAAVAAVALTESGHQGQAYALTGPEALSFGEMAEVLFRKHPQLAKWIDLRTLMWQRLEALTAESFLAARRAGVEEAVLASLQSSDPGIDWQAALTDQDRRVREVQHDAEVRLEAVEGAARDVRELEEGLFDERFLLARPVLRALREAPAVLLVDEVDRVEIETDSELTIGQTVVDWWGVTGSEPNVMVMSDVDRQGFIDLVVERISRL